MLYAVIIMGQFNSPPPCLYLFIVGKLYLWIHSDEEFDNFVKTRQVLDELDVERYRVADCLVMQEVCSVVSTRAAYLAAAGNVQI